MDIKDDWSEEVILATERPFSGLFTGQGASQGIAVGALQRGHDFPGELMASAGFPDTRTYLKKV
ncbi:MAG: hypothetical protein PVG19_06830 [Desulfobacterales bacterium]